MWPRKTSPPSISSRRCRWGAPDKWDYLAYDEGSQRVFLAHDTEITVLDGATGAVVGRVEGLDKAHGVAFVGRLHRGYATNNGRVFDAKRQIAFSSNGDGTLSMLAEKDGGSLAVLPALQTAAGARTMTLDQKTGRIFLVAGDVGADPTSILPGSLKLLILEAR